MKNEKNDILFVEMTANRFRAELEKASVLGAMKALELCGMPIKDMYSRSELSKKYGKGKINRMIESGVITPYAMDGGRPKYKLSEVLLTIN